LLVGYNIVSLSASTAETCHCLRDSGKVQGCLYRLQTHHQHR